MFSLQTLVKANDLTDNNTTSSIEPYHFSAKEYKKIWMFLLNCSQKINIHTGIIIRLYKTGMVLYGRASSTFLNDDKPLPQKILKELDLSIWAESPYSDYPKFLPDTAAISITENPKIGILRRWDYVGNITSFSRTPSASLLKALQNIREGKINEAYDYFFQRYDNYCLYDKMHSTDMHLTPFILCKNIFAVAYVDYFKDQYGTYSDSPLNKVIQAIPELFAYNISNNDKVNASVKVLDSVLRYIPIEPEKDRKINPVATKALYDILDEVVKNSRDVVIIEDKDFDRCKFHLSETFR